MGSEPLGQWMERAVGYAGFVVALSLTTAGVSGCGADSQRALEASPKMRGNRFYFSEMGQLSGPMLRMHVELARCSSISKSTVEAIQPPCTARERGMCLRRTSSGCDVQIEAQREQWRRYFAQVRHGEGCWMAMERSGCLEHTKPDYAVHLLDDPEMTRTHGTSPRPVMALCLDAVSRAPLLVYLMRHGTRSLRVPYVVTDSCGYRPPDVSMRVSEYARHLLDANFPFGVCRGLDTSETDLDECARRWWYFLGLAPVTESALQCPRGTLPADACPALPED